ncbi:putative lipoprotein [Treponema primitia ZAS-2]|uniref:Putative lipoprotein n=1 Tax=Treponema primitia (strain ATCC BAA-887 / DSM 12427 / ZAS-2) TaxID=545694 RepID=F5YK39_TREPZ|nr:LPP20 family lipoprotein [Treponema primitia]AEF85695.1 putative lipoprotein [Treponema primitia ZAS-2]
MKKWGFIYISLIIAAFVLAGCGSAPAPADPQTDPNSPEWLNDFPPEDAIWGIGTAKQSSDSLSMSTAETRARTSIARQLDIKVKAMFTNYQRDAGTIGSQTALSLQEDVSNQVTSMQLSGSRPIKRWKAPDGTWWYLIEYKIADAKAALSTVIDDEAARFSEFKAAEALKMLDAQLAKSEKPQPVNN